MIIYPLLTGLLCAQEMAAQALLRLDTNPSFTTYFAQIT